MVRGAWWATVQFNSFVQSCLTLCNPMDCSMPGFPPHCQLPEFSQTHVHWVADAIQPSHPLLSPSPSCLHSFPASGSFPMSQFFTSSGQSIGVSASASVQWILRTHKRLIKKRFHKRDLREPSAPSTAWWCNEKSSTQTRVLTSPLWHPDLSLSVSRPFGINVCGL